MLEQSMDELKRAKMDLPPPPAPNEKPQKPFGEFQEQNFESKVNILTPFFFKMTSFLIELFSLFIEVWYS